MGGENVAAEAFGTFNVDYLTLVLYTILRDCARVREGVSEGCGGYFVQGPGDVRENKIELRPPFQPALGETEGVEVAAARAAEEGVETGGYQVA